MSQNKINELLKKEMLENNESYWWLSFCDPNKPRGEQFLGVIITKALGMTHAMNKTHNMRINPGGEIQFVKLNIKDIRKINNLKDRLLNKKELEENGFI